MQRIYLFFVFFGGVVGVLDTGDWSHVDLRARNIQPPYWRNQEIRLSLSQYYSIFQHQSWNKRQVLKYFTVSLFIAIIIEQASKKTMWMWLKTQWVMVKLMQMMAFTKMTPAGSASKILDYSTCQSQSHFCQVSETEFHHKSYTYTPKTRSSNDQMMSPSPDIARWKPVRSVLIKGSSFFWLSL